MLSARVTYDKSVDSYDVEFVIPKYDKQGWESLRALVTIFKSTISVSNRIYDPVTKHWSFTANAFRDIVEKLFISTSTQYDIQDAVATVGPEGFFYEHAVASPMADTPEVLAARLQALLGLDNETMLDVMLVKKAYRRKAMELHPDRNDGDGSRMSALNEVWNAYVRS
jgi:hypothetical protein